MADTVSADIVEDGHRGMGVTEGISEYEVGPRVMANRDGEGVEGHDQPYLGGTDSEGKISGLAHLEGMGGGCVVGVDHNVEPGGDIRTRGPHRENDVEGLNLVDEGVGVGEL